MKTNLTLLLTLFFVAGCTIKEKSSQDVLNHIFTTIYEYSIISKGDNLPNFDRRKDSIALFLVALHENIEPGKFQEKANWSDEELEEKIQFLIERGWLIRDEHGIRPTVFIVSDHQGQDLFKHGLLLSEDIADAIEKEIPLIMEKFHAYGLSELYDFENMSFLVLSNVLLDNWQIMEMEAAYLKKENRPERHGKFYYASIEENVNNAYEPFGIYGNNRIVVNQRLNNDPVFKDSVLNVALELTPDLYIYFNEIAADFKPKLLKILNDRTEYSHEVFEITGYANEINFEEFFIWWYHFIYTDVTNILAERGRLIIPEDGNFYYK
jgi:hypothetical protein